VYSKNGSSFLSKILQLAKERDELRVVNDQIGTPTWCRSISDVTGKIIKQMTEKKEGSLAQISSSISGVYHMTCRGQTNWHNFARAILELTCPEKVPNLLAISTKEYPTRAARPLYSVLSNVKLKKSFGVALPHWEDALKSCLKGI
jgi:dTDP-4-dehydrorhamnose reductase